MPSLRTCKNQHNASMTLVLAVVVMGVETLVSEQVDHYRSSTNISVCTVTALYFTF
jgi:hypothetical protein